MTALYGRWHHARQAINKAIDAGAVHMEMIYAGGGRGGTNAVVVGRPPCTARLKGTRSKKATNSWLR